MKKILLVTWYENNNYGTALQAYALKSIIEKPMITGLDLNVAMQECICDILPHKPEKQRKNNRFIKLFFPHSYLLKLQQIQDKKIYKKKKILFNLREKAFDKFLRQNFNFATDHYVQDVIELQQLGENYDLVVSGSDQIWNPEALDSTYLLEWVKAGKKLSYGSSLSTKSIPAEYEHLFETALKDFKAISIRDRMCRDQLAQIVGKPVSTVVDPVVLLGRDGLLRNAIRLVLPPYMFCYFLGNNRKHRQWAILKSSEMKLPIHAVINAGSDYRADKTLEKYADWDVDPWKFVSYINEASIVVTDSFHATVISVLCHTNFIVLEKDSSRPEQNNRILEFLDVVGLRERWGNVPQKTEISEKQWNYADRILGKMRQDSLEFLLEALK
ncbi:polysaccharide pyruvyl transferase family protein [Lachnoclostridium sp. An169]|uniref:polysaccharide pyruvyl transferase family protein n=1 Tax=Lachnoclostridium sp. An169 TaxID=1965569 RepID=UPI0013A5FB80|nr:polysaccharide pyruvyl transferase family protein [Lachnoclostridium sp. An169]